MDGVSPYIIDPELEQAIESGFLVEDRYLEYNIPTFIVSPRGGVYQPAIVKEPFKKVVRESRERGYLPFLRREEGRLIIRLLEKKPVGRPSYRWNILLFIATICTISYDGYLRSAIPIFTKELMPNVPVFVNVLLFLASILGIFGLHELAHKFTSMMEGVEASMPYFIPAPPGIGGTWGAVITQKEPPANRDALFDLGLSGPLIGFLVTVVVSIVGITHSFIVPYAKLTEWSIKYGIGFQSLPMPPLINLLIPILKPYQPTTHAFLLHPLAFAAWVGCLVTFINLIPIWQLDGGHVTRALFGAEKHRILSMFGLVVMVLSGYYIMAILIAIGMFRSRGDVGPLDDVSTLSPGRKVFTLVYIAIIALTFVIFNPLII